MKRIVLALIKSYQKYLSPFFTPACRFSPTCSQYAVEAINRYSLGKALLMSVYRVLRCNPFNAGGYDPVK